MMFIGSRCIWFCGCISFIHKYLNVLVGQLSVVQILQRERYLYKPVHHLNLVKLTLVGPSLVYKGVLCVRVCVCVRVFFCVHAIHSDFAQPTLPYSEYTHPVDADFQVAAVAVFHYQKKVIATQSGNSRAGIIITHRRSFNVWRTNRYSQKQYRITPTQWSIHEDTFTHNVTHPCAKKSDSATMLGWFKTRRTEAYSGPVQFCGVEAAQSISKIIPGVRSDSPYLLIIERRQVWWQNSEEWRESRSGNNCVGQRARKSGNKSETNQKIRDFRVAQGCQNGPKIDKNSYEKAYECLERFWKDFFQIVVWF